MKLKFLFLVLSILPLQAEGDFFTLLEQRNYPAMEEFLQDNTVYQRDDISFSNHPLIYAVDEGDEELVRFLLDQQVSYLYGSGSYDGVLSCVYRAIRRKETDILRILIEGGADFDAGFELDTIYDFHALRAGDLETAQLLIDLGYNLNRLIHFADNGAPGQSIRSFLFSKVVNDDTEMVQFLLENGMDPNLLGASVHPPQHPLERFTALDLATNSDMKSLLLSYGAMNASDFSIPEILQQANGAFYSQVNNSGVRVRDNSSLDGNVVFSLNQGDSVRVFQRSSDTQRIGDFNDYWYIITDAQGNWGWIYGAFIDFGK